MIATTLVGRKVKYLDDVEWKFACIVGVIEDPYALLMENIGDHELWYYLPGTFRLWLIPEEK